MEERGSVQQPSPGTPSDRAPTGIVYDAGRLVKSEVRRAPTVKQLASKATTTLVHLVSLLPPQLSQRQLQHRRVPLLRSLYSPMPLFNLMPQLSPGLANGQPRGTTDAVALHMIMATR